VAVAAWHGDARLPDATAPAVLLWCGALLSTVLAQFTLPRSGALKRASTAAVR
jgi:hypothetical protein